MLLCLPVQWQERNLGRAQCHDWAYIDDGPVGDPDANSRLYDFLKEKKQRSSHFMIGTNVHDGPQLRSGHVDCHSTANVPAAGGAASDSQVTSTPIGMANTATAYCHF